MNRHLALGAFAALIVGCVDFNATGAEVCRQRPDLCGTTGGGEGGGGGGMGGGGGGGAADAGQPRLSWGTVSSFTGFADAGTARVATLTNQGTRATGPITLTWERGGDAGFLLTSHTCSTLNPGQNCRATVEFAPTDEGLVTADLLAGDGETSALVTLTGTGTDPICHVTVVIRSELDAGGTVALPPEARCDAGTCAIEYPRSGASTFYDATPAPGSMVSWVGQTIPGASGYVGRTQRFVSLEVVFTRPNFAFATSSTVDPATLGASQPAEVTANALCQAHALDAGLPGTYRAFISHRLDAGTARYVPSQQLTMAAGWTRPDGLPVMLASLSDSTGYLPLLDEHGVRLPTTGRVLTGGGLNGSGRDCLNWTSAAATYSAGDPSSDTQWTQTVSNGSTQYRNCTLPAHLYCFGVDRKGAQLHAPGPTRAAFCLPTVTPAQGLSTIDAACAAAAGRDGGVLGAVARPGETPLSRFDAGGPPWARADGVLLASTAAALFTPDASVLAPIWLGPTTSRSVTTCAFGVVLGSPSLNQPGTLASTCSGWTSTGGSVIDVVGADVDLPLASATGNGCLTTVPILCLEE